MAITPRNIFYKWFKKDAEPTERQFWSTFDSFWHKFEKIPASMIEGLNQLILGKADAEKLDNHINDTDVHLTPDQGQKLEDLKNTELSELLNSDSEQIALNLKGAKALKLVQLALQDEVTLIKNMLASDDTTLDEIKEIVAFIKQNKEDLQNLSINNIAGLVDALSSKITFNADGAENKFFNEKGEAISIPLSEALNQDDVNTALNLKGAKALQQQIDNKNVLQVKNYLSRVIPKQSLAYFHSNGAIRIALPSSLNNRSIRVTISGIIDIYGENKLVQFSVGGQINSGELIWNQNSKAIFSTSDNLDVNYNVRFGIEEETKRRLIYIGELNSNWSYTNIALMNCFGYPYVEDELLEGWDISLENDAFENISQTVVNSGKQELTPSTGIPVHLASGKSFGKYVQGDVIPGGVSLIDLVKQAVSEDVPVEFIPPIYNVVYKNIAEMFDRTYYVGQKIQLEIQREFIQNDSGSLIDFEVFLNGASVLKNNQNTVTIELVVNQFEKEFVVKSLASYQAGSGVRTNSLGIEYTNNILAGATNANNVEIENLPSYEEQMLLTDFRLDGQTELRFNMSFQVLCKIVSSSDVNFSTDTTISYKHIYEGFGVYDFYNIKKYFKIFIPNILNVNEIYLSYTSTTNNTVNITQQMTTIDVSAYTYGDNNDITLDGKWYTFNNTITDYAGNGSLKITFN